MGESKPTSEVQIGFQEGDRSILGFSRSELLYERIEETPDFKGLHQQIIEDGDVIFKSESLSVMKTMHPRLRLRLLAEATNKIYLGADDFEPYFVLFPEDAHLVAQTVIDNIDIGPNPDYLRYILGCKVLEPSAKVIPGLWEHLLEMKKNPRFQSEYELANYLNVSKRSKLARQKLIGDYKKEKDFQQFGSKIAEVIQSYWQRVCKIRQGFWYGYIEPQEEIYNDTAYQNLSVENKAKLNQELIEKAHNTIVYDEVYNWCPGSETIRDDSNTRMIHSVLYETPHMAKVYSLPSKRLEIVPPVINEMPGTELTLEATIQAAIKELEKYGSTENVDFLLNFWDKNRDPYYGPAIARTISKIDVQRGVAGILERLPNTSEDDQRRLLSLLYRLELGRVGISQEGLDYLGRRFDLGEYNRSENFAQRITADGKVGVFDSQRQLAGFVQLEAGDFTGKPDEHIRKEILAITKEMLFYQRADENPGEQEIRQRILREFCQKYFENFMQLFGEHADFKFNNLNLREQGWALQYLDGADESRRENFFAFANQFGEAGVKSLIAMEYGAELGDELITVCQREPKKGQRFLESFTQLIDLAEQYGSTWERVLPAENPFINPTYLSAQITEAILRKNKDFIIAFKEANGKIKLPDVLASVSEFAFVLGQMNDVLTNQGQGYNLIKKDIDRISGSQTWIFKQPEFGYQVNLTLRENPSQQKIHDKRSGGYRIVSTQSSIRTDFIWLDKTKFGIRLDIDPFYHDENFPNGRLALDIGSRDSKIAYILDQISPEGHHNIQSFSPELSRPETFSNLCRTLNNHLEQTYGQARAA